MDDRHNNLFLHCTSIDDAYEHLKRDQDGSLNKRGLWRGALYIIACVIASSVIAGGDLWKWFLLPLIFVADRAFWHAIEVSNRNYCMHVFSAISAADRNLMNAADEARLAPIDAALRRGGLL